MRVWVDVVVFMDRSYSQSFAFRLMELPPCLNCSVFFSGPFWFPASYKRGQIQRIIYFWLFKVCLSLRFHKTVSIEILHFCCCTVCVWFPVIVSSYLLFDFIRTTHGSKPSWSLWCNNTVLLLHFKNSLRLRHLVIVLIPYLFECRVHLCFVKFYHFVLVAYQANFVCG